MVLVIDGFQRSARGSNEGRSVGENAPCTHVIACCSDSVELVAVCLLLGRPRVRPDHECLPETTAMTAWLRVGTKHGDVEDTTPLLDRMCGRVSCMDILLRVATYDWCGAARVESR